MTAVVWRLHRQQVYFSGFALAGVAVVLVVTGSVMAGDYHRFLASCAASGSCADGHRVFDGDGFIIDLVYASMVVPLLVGLFWGAPLVGREFEEGTNSLAWTQGITRRRWLTHTMGWVLLGGAAWGAAMAGLVTWWRSPENALEMPVRLATGAFDIQGIAPIAYSLFAISLGIAAGSVFRRVLPAMAVTLGIFVVVRVVIADFLRPHLLPAITKVLPFGLAPGPNGGSLQIGPSAAPPSGSWVVSNLIEGPSGQHILHGDISSVLAVPRRCTVPSSSGCAGWHLIVSYQPPGRFWPIQGVESAIFVLLAAVLVWITYLLVTRRDA